jgi:hypothetical protein
MTASILLLGGDAAAEAPGAQDAHAADEAQDRLDPASTLLF